jgi:hypothetical protein
LHLQQPVYFCLYSCTHGAKIQKILNLRRNSWDCYGPTVEEHEVKANADYMANKPGGQDYYNSIINPKADYSYR